MEELDISELRQLVSFYRQRAYDLEFQSLQLQLKLNKILASFSTSESEDLTDKTKSE